MRIRRRDAAVNTTHQANFMKNATTSAIGLILLATMLFVAGCETKPIVKKATQIPVAKDSTLPLPKITDLWVGQNLVVVLPAKAGADVVWRAQTPLPDFLSLASETTQTSLGGEAGAPDQQVFNFSAKSAGDASLSFLLVRRSALDSPPLEIRTTRVIVTPR